MTKEALEKAQAALANLEAHQRLLEKIKASTAIVIGITTFEMECTFKDGIIIGLKSPDSRVIGDWNTVRSNSYIRDACLNFHQEMIRILEKEVSELQSKFQKL